MAYKFRLAECVVLLALIVFVFPNNIANQKIKGKRFHNLKGILPFLEKKGKPMFNNRFLDWNLTSQLSAARYMLNLYKSIGTGEDNSQSFNVSNVTKTTKQVDTIMGIQNDATDNKTKLSAHQMTLKFNFTAKIQSGDSVEAAEFHIYKNKAKQRWMENISFIVELSIFFIPDPNKTEKVKSTLATRVMQGSKVGWEIFDVKKTVDMWIVSPGNNYGLQVSVTFPRPVPFISFPIDPTLFGFVGFSGPYNERPFIVSFFQGDPTEKLVIHASNRKKRSLFKPAKLRHGYTSSSSECKKRHLYVDFHELRWENWIIAPDGYESYYCAGECHYVLNPSNANSTNHAIVQSLVNLLNADSAPPPCCAPTKLKAISVLYYDEKKNVVLKKFQDMVVKSCGCH